MEIQSVIQVLFFSVCVHKKKSVSEQIAEDSFHMISFVFLDHSKATTSTATVSII